MLCHNVLTVYIGSNDAGSAIDIEQRMYTAAYGFRTDVHEPETMPDISDRPQHPPQLPVPRVL